MIIAGSIISGTTNDIDAEKKNIQTAGGSITAQWNNEIIEAEYIYSEVNLTRKTGWNAWAGHTFKTNSKFMPAIQILARYEQYDVDIDIAGNQKDRMTLGTNFYIDNKFTKIQLNYQINNEEINSIDNNEFLVSIQVAF